MTPLEAARQIASTEPLGAYGDILSCVYCYAVRASDFAPMPVREHEAWCPWLAMPAIVAALEAAREGVPSSQD